MAHGTQAAIQFTGSTATCAPLHASCICGISTSLYVIQRGHNREPCFYTTEDYRRYQQDLQDAAATNLAVIHAYVLMTNHVHLLVTSGRPHSITHMMQDLGRQYVRYINHTYLRSGTLWEGRFKASLIDSEAYLFTCMRYIEMHLFLLLQNRYTVHPWT